MFQKFSRMRSLKTSEDDLEKRLTAYYGPPLPPRALSEAAWFQLRSRLSPTTPRRWPRLQQILVSQRSRVPFELQEAFSSLLRQIDYAQPYPDLRCSFRATTTRPAVTVSPLGHGRIHLILPGQNWHTAQPLALDFLMSTGLARYARASRPLFLLPRLLLICSLLFIAASLPLMTIDKRFLSGFLLALASAFALGCLFSWQQRLLTFRADLQAVRWLGRERVCQGLHLLASYERTPRWPKASEPSLNKRIARVCSMPIAAEDEYLTLAR